MSQMANNVSRPAHGSGSTEAADNLVLDAHTVKDLEIFESEAGGTTLFDLCNLSRSAGGAKVLRQRMARPWADGDRIRTTQVSLSYIQSTRAAFKRLPSAFASNRVDHYVNGILPIVVHENPVEFGIEAMSLWANHDRRYGSILHGVKLSCGLVQSLRAFLAQPTLADPLGELAPLLEEMRSLMARPRFKGVPEDESGRWAWQMLRLDQVFRIHETEAIRRLLHLIYEIDALVAMADATEQYGFVLPDVLDGPLRVQAEDLVHPLVEAAVANPVELDQARRVLFLTGPNMAGKTTYLRAVATALYLAHLGMGVPARSFRFVPAERLYSSISLSDNLLGGVSYFRAEALRVKAVAESVAEGRRVIALMDEPFKGTNVKDALDASLAVLERFATKNDCLFLCSSHLIELSDKLGATGHIDCRNFEADEGEGRLRFDYLLRSGVSSQRLGMRVLREEGVFELLDGDAVRVESGES